MLNIIYFIVFHYLKAKNNSNFMSLKFKVKIENKLNNNQSVLSLIISDLDIVWDCHDLTKLVSCSWVENFNFNTNDTLFHINTS